MPEPDETKLLVNAQNGDTDSFGTLVSIYQERAYSVALGMMGDPHDALDVVQESFIKAFRNIRKFNFNSTFNTWLHRIVTNTAIDELRKRKKHSNVVSLDKTFDGDEGEYVIQFDDKSADVQDILESKERLELLEKSLMAMKEEHRMIIVLSDVKGYDYNEISTMLNLPLGTVKSRIARARAKLVETLKNQGTNYGF
ncbi:MAG: sigma-70 family RNA polymerase sigma factor [Clostridia bacterium]